MKSIVKSPLFDDEDEEEKKKAPEMPDPLTEKFLKTRQIILSGEINKDLADKIVRQLLVLEADDAKKQFTCTSTLPAVTLMQALQFLT